MPCGLGSATRCGKPDRRVLEISNVEGTAWSAIDLPDGNSATLVSLYDRTNQSCTGAGRPQASPERCIDNIALSATHR
jgi:hypothetical protein